MVTNELGAVSGDLLLTFEVVKTERNERKYLEKNSTNKRTNCIYLNKLLLAIILTKCTFFTHFFRG